MDQAIIRLYDEYTHAPLDRRVFLDRLTRLAGSAAAAAALLPLLESNYALAQIVPADDPRIVAERTSYPGEGTDIEGYLARPAGEGPFPAVIVIHENRGLNPHLEDVARRLAVTGYLALAVDLLSPLGGTPGDQDQAREMIGQLDPAQTTANLVAAVAFLAGHPDGNGKVGAVGFCWGGGQVLALATAAPDLDAAVAYYGPPPAAERAADIQAPLLIHLAGLDDRINGMFPPFEEALQAAGKDYTIERYEGVNHAFNNDTGAERYDKAAADLAWQRTLDFFATHLAA